MKRKNYKTMAVQLGQLLLAAIFVLVFHCKFQVYEIAGSGAPIDFFSNLGNSFTSSNFIDIFAWIAAYFMIRYVSQRDNTIDPWAVVVAAVFSVSYVLSSSFLAYNSSAFLTQNWYQAFLSTFCIVGYFLIFYFGIRAMLIYLGEHNEKFLRELPLKRNDEHFWTIGFWTIFLCWLPWILMNYPGSFCFDSHLQLREYFGDASFTAHIPPLSTYIMGGLITIGQFFADANFGAFLYLFLQTLVGALVFSFGVERLYAAGLRLSCCYIFILFYAISPVWGSFAQWYEKDLLYAEASTLFLILIIGLVAKRQCDIKDVAALIATGLLASLLRNNGIYEVIPSILLLAFYVQKHFRRQIWIVLSGTLTAYMCVVRIIYPSVLGIEDGPLKEALSFPVQQTARYVAEHGGEVTEYERQVIDGVLDYSLLADKYNPLLSDPIKDLYKGDASKLPEYFKVWFEMGLKHAETYAASFWNGAYGYLAPVRANIEAPVWTDLEGPRITGGESILTRIGLHRVFDDLPSSILTCLRRIGQNGPFLISCIAMPGLYTWILIMCATVLIKNRRYGALIIVVPAIMNVLVCIASPLANAIRYELPVVAAAPLLLGWTFILTVNKNNTKAPHDVRHAGKKKPVSGTRV